MFKKILALLAALYAVASFAAVDVNKASVAELDGLKGIGPGISSKIIDERKKGDFKDWQDFIDRVKGVGEKNAVKFSAEGMTVNGTSYSGAPAAPAKKQTTKTTPKDAKPAAVATVAPAEAKPAAATTATAATAAAEVNADPKAQAKAQKAAAKQAKAEAKAKAAEEKKAQKEAAKAQATATQDGAKKQ